MCILLGLVRLDLGVGGGLDCDGEEVVGVVSCEMKIILSNRLNLITDIFNLGWFSQSYDTFKVKCKKLLLP